MVQSYLLNKIVETYGEIAVKVIIWRGKKKKNAKN